MKRLSWFLCLFISVLFHLIPVIAWAQYNNGFNPYYQDSSTGSIILRYLIHLLIAAVIGAAVGAFFSDRFRHIRKWIALGSIALILILLSIVSVYFADLAVGTITAVVVYILLRNKKRTKASSSVFGSARWADIVDLVESDLIGEEGFFLGRYEYEAPTIDKKNPIVTKVSPLQYKGDRHLLTVAPTRSGKGVSSIIPNLLLYSGSTLIIDPKGENAMITAARRGAGDETHGIAGLKQEVHILDPWGITGKPAARFNPMDWLRPDDENIVDNAMMLADAIVKPHAGTKEPFWDEEAKALLMGLLLFVALDEDEQANRNLGRVRDIAVMGSDQLEDVLTRMQSHDHPIVRSTAERTRSKESKLLGSVLATLQAHTHFLDSSRIRASLMASDFKFEDLKSRPMTVYLVLPADRLETFGRWLRLLVQQAITVNARNIDVKPEKPVLFLLDEMAALGRLTMVEQAFGLMAGFGMQLWGIVQDLSQLERIYDKGWETFIGNSGVLQYFGSRDKKSAEYFSALCGVMTRKKFSFASAISNTFSGGEKPSSSSTRSDTTTTDFVSRPLVYPDELMVLKNDQQLLIVENGYPIAGQKVRWFEDQALASYGVSLQKDSRPQLKPGVENPEGVETPLLDQA